MAENTTTTRSEQEIRNAVRERYGTIARESARGAASCCAASTCGCGTAATSVADRLYEADVSDLPTDVTGMSLGCGDPITIAQLQPGQTVVDLGSGGGIDCFLAAKKVGPTGHVIGVDMTADMIDRARTNAAKVGAQNVEFRLGEIEHLPMGDGTVDVIISNCVINLSPDKPQVFRDAFRVLRPGGRLAVSDIVSRVQLSPDRQRDLASWAGCVAGAWVDKDYVAALEAAGFEDVEIEGKSLGDLVDTYAAAIEADESLKSTAKALAEAVYSARVTARKPL